MELEARSKTLLVHQHDDSDFGVDEIPITKMDFSNMDIHKDNVASQGAREEGKGKGVLVYENELKEKKKKLYSIEKNLQSQEHALDM